jgi:acyl-CoA hydrolase
LKEGAGVVTTRGHIHWVVTEFGAVDLFGKSLKQRARALISIAHLSHRDALEKAFCERFGSYHRPTITGISDRIFHP